MKILQLCNKFPYPPNDGGSIAVFNLTKYFSENQHQVTVLAMNTNKHNTDIDNIPERLRQLINFHFIPVDTHIKPLRLLLNLLFSSKPYNAVRFIDKKFGLYLQGLLVEDQFDIVQLEGPYLAPYIKQIRKYSNAIISLRAHNVEHEIWKRSAENLSPGAKKFYFNTIAYRLEQFEKRTMDQYDLLIPITNRDALKLEEMGNTKPYKVIPAGIPANEFLNSSAPNKIDSLFYIGALDWIPNQDGLKWFIKEVWNDLRNSNPDLSFHIAGRNAPRWFANFCENNGVKYHGEVESAKEFYENFHIMVVPLFAGSGMRIKIIEAMARSKLVITTPIGAEGLGLTNKEHAIIADEASEMKKGILNLLENKEFFAKLEKNSFNFIKENFSNEKIGKELIDFYTQQLKT